MRQNCTLLLLDCTEGTRFETDFAHALCFGCMRQNCTPPSLNCSKNLPGIFKTHCVSLSNLGNTTRLDLADTTDAVRPTSRPSSSFDSKCRPLMKSTLDCEIQPRARSPSIHQTLRTSRTKLPPRSHNHLSVLHHSNSSLPLEIPTFPHLMDTAPIMKDKIDIVVVAQTIQSDPALAKLVED